MTDTPPDVDLPELVAAATDTVREIDGFRAAVSYVPDDDLTPLIAARDRLADALEAVAGGPDA